jgi:hypothetical protein
MAQVFTKFEVYHKALGGTLLAWELNPLFTSQVPGPYTFTAYASRPGVSNFLSIGSVVNGYTIEDSTRWVYGKRVRLHYRVDLVDGDGGDWSSDVKQGIGNHTTRFQAVADEIIRKELLHMEGAGECGWLYKKRKWGTKCPDCLDYNTGQVTNAHCATCYGTGYTGGYFTPVQYWVMELGKQQIRQHTDQSRGFVDDQQKLVRGVNCPWLDSYDFWVDFDSDKRYVIHNVKPLDYQGVTVIFSPIEFRLAPTSDIIYELTRPDESS